ncbi:hypothetical protein BRADI_4g04880v3 [Brachypodium distachyon]|uniref:Calmodulin-binding protein n=1 Tax=Brachypodium distachyon TaxID=15368 RepID=A0A2K2CKI2_BRADI|nr:hypothetical protein BRADI_4g04880v3 [Brachypodium distachyon]
MAPKRELVLAACAGREAAKRLRVGVQGTPSAGGSQPAPPSPGTRLLRQTVLVMLFLLRMSERITVTESISQIGRMVQKLHKVQNLIMSLQYQMEGISHEVKKLSCSRSNHHADQDQRNEPGLDCTTASGWNANIHLRFRNDLKTPIYTEKNITAEGDQPIRIGMFEGDNMITGGPLSKAKIEILVLRGDFPDDGKERWTEEEFNSYIAQGRDGQGSVLVGNYRLRLNNGEAFLKNIRFKEGSCRTPSRKFVVAARICVSEKTNVRVHEAIMKSVPVLDRRNAANEKRHPPKLSDEVYRLEEIANGGTYHKRLKNKHIFTVEDFLKTLNKDANYLRKEVLLINKPHSPWEKMVKHARECCLKDRHELKAYHNEGNVVIFFNCVYDLIGAEFAGDYITQNNFDSDSKALANELKERVCDKLDSLPFNYKMIGDLPVPVTSSTNSSAGASILAPDAALQASKSQCDDRNNHASNSFYQNPNFSSSSSIHDYQNTVGAHYCQGEGIPSLCHQPSTSVAPYWQQDLGPINSTYRTNVWDYGTPGCCFQGQVNNHGQMQAPFGGIALEASTSAQHNLMPHQLPPYFQGNMPELRCSEDLPNPVAEPSSWRNDGIPEPSPFRDTNLTDDSPFEGSGQVNNHGQMQAPFNGIAFETSTSAQHNLLPQQFPPYFQGNMPELHYSEDLPNPVAEPSSSDNGIPEPEPSTRAFQGPGYGNF